MASSSSSSSTPPPPKPLSAPSTTSANPSSSPTALWTYIEPALHHILRSPSNDPNKAPTLDVAYHVGIHTAVYNYFTSPEIPASNNNHNNDTNTTSTTSPSTSTSTPTSTSTKLPTPKSPSTTASQKSKSPPPISLPSISELGLFTGGGGGEDDFREGVREGLYTQIDDYFAEVAREILLGAAQDEITLVQYLVPAFSRYSAGVRAVDRLLNYVNRHYVKRVASEDKGWLSLKDLLDEPSSSSASPTSSPNPNTDLGSLRLVEARAKLSVRLRDRKSEELKKWGYDPSVDPVEKRAEAEACAEAASGLDRVIPLGSLGHRRFRVEVLEPLLAVPKAKKKKGKGKAKPVGVIQNGGGGSGGSGTEKKEPKGRLARAVKELLENRDGGLVDEAERRRLAEGVARMLAVTGVRPDHPLRKRLRIYLQKTANAT